MIHVYDEPIHMHDTWVKSFKWYVCLMYVSHIGHTSFICMTCKSYKRYLIPIYHVCIHMTWQSSHPSDTWFMIQMHHVRLDMCIHISYIRQTSYICMTCKSYMIHNKYVRYRTWYIHTHQSSTWCVIIHQPIPSDASSYISLSTHTQVMRHHTSAYRLRAFSCMPRVPNHTHSHTHTHTRTQSPAHICTYAHVHTRAGGSGLMCERYVYGSGWICERCV